jgi:hypothetical protein
MTKEFLKFVAAGAQHNNPPATTTPELLFLHERTKDACLEIFCRFLQHFRNNRSNFVH